MNKPSPRLANVSKNYITFEGSTSRSQTEQHNVPEQLNFAARCVGVREKKVEQTLSPDAFLFKRALRTFLDASVGRPEPDP
jgi:hypothetical protein